MKNTQVQNEPLKPLHQFIQLIEKKCLELPYDIDHWIKMAAKHAPQSKTYRNIINSSVKPREEYLEELEKLRLNLHEVKAIVEGKGFQIEKEVTMDMPIETLLRKYVTFSEQLKKVAESNQTFIQFYESIMKRIQLIRTELNQTILRCSMGDINYKDAEHQLKMIQPNIEEHLERHVDNTRGRLSEFSEVLLQKVELDISTRKAIQDRLIMHSTLETYLAHLESNKDFKYLLPTLQYKIRKIVTNPLDSILTEQQEEVDVARYELQQTLEPVQGRATLNVPKSAESVHQLIQQAINQQEQLSKLKVNVMGAFKHLVTQLDNLFEFQPIAPIQAASVLGASWMQHPLTSVKEIRKFKNELSSIKQTDSFKKLSQCLDEQTVHESFSFIDKKMDEMSDQLEMNSKIHAMKKRDDQTDLPNLLHANDIGGISQAIKPIDARRIIVQRTNFLLSVKQYIQQLCDSVRAHLFLVYYEHSLNPDKVNLNAKINKVLNQVSQEFYDNKNCDETIDKNVFMSSVKQVFEEICDSELEKNMDIFSQRQKIKELMITLKETNKFSRKDIRKKIIMEKNDLKQLMIKTNIPRLKQFISILSDGGYETIHIESIAKVEKLKGKLRSLIQQQVALEQVVVL